MSLYRTMKKLVVCVCVRARTKLGRQLHSTFARSETKFRKASKIEQLQLVTAVSLRLTGSKFRKASKTCT